MTEWTPAICAETRATEWKSWKRPDRGMCCTREPTVLWFFPENSAIMHFKVETTNRVSKWRENLAFQTLSVPNSFRHIKPRAWVTGTRFWNLTEEHKQWPAFSSRKYASNSSQRSTRYITYSKHPYNVNNPTSRWRSLEEFWISTAYSQSSSHNAARFLCNGYFSVKSIWFSRA